MTLLLSNNDTRLVSGNFTYWRTGWSGQTPCFTVSCERVGLLVLVIKSLAIVSFRGARIVDIE